MKDYLSIYHVDNKIYHDKIEAVLEACKTDADIVWDFHKETFSQIDWTVEPTLSLTELYKIRAHQIRDEYDYVVIMFSGGADSTNLLNSFLVNNIHVDEIVAGIPLSGLNNFKATTDTGAYNNASEWLLTTMPYLHEVSLTHPKIKISINDFFKTMLDYKTDEWLHQSSDHIHPTTVARYRIDQLTHIKALAEQGKKIGVVYGIEKPKLSFDKGVIYSEFNDASINVPRQPFDTFYPNVDIVLYYSTPKLPELVIKQSHEVIKMIKLPQFQYIKDYIYDSSKHFYVTNYQTLWSEEKKQFVAERNGTYERAIVPIIYPDIDMSSTFQAKKAKEVFMASHDYWFYSGHKETRLHQLVRSDFSLFLKNIKHKYLRPGGVGFKLYSNRYAIGKIE